MDDTQAIQRIKDGDLAGLETLMRRYQVLAARVAFLITHDEGLAEDVVQETFVRVYERIDQFNPTLPFKAYLMRSVVNAALNAVRKDFKVDSLDAELGRLDVLLDRAASVESQVEFAQLQQDILTALGELPPRQRTVIVQRYYLEMTEKEMAQALSAAPGTIKWTLNAARERLRRILGQKGAFRE